MESEMLSLDRIPLPSLRVYTGLSVLAATFSIVYIGSESGTAWTQVSSEKLDSCKLNLLMESPPELEKSDSLPLASESVSLTMFASYYWWHNETERDQHSNRNVTETDCFNEGYQQLTWQLFQWASRQPYCVWPLVNLVYCLLIFGSQSVQRSVFGSLRSSEEENIKDQFWNLVFYKIVFVFGVVDVQEVGDAVGWCFFVSVIGFLQLARQLCQERHNYLIMVNDMTKASEARRHRILHLLVVIFVTSILLFSGVIAWFMNSSPKEFSKDFLDLSDIIPFTRPYDETPVQEPSTGYDLNLGLHSAIFMLSEISLLIMQTLHALTMCILDQMYFREVSCKWNPLRIFADKMYSQNDEEDLYMCASQDINYKFEIVSLMFDLVHHVHMFVCCNLFLSMTSLIVSLQMRLRVKQIHAVLKRRHSFTTLNEHIDRYADVQHEDADECNKDNCAICWESLSSQLSKALPCKHIFHKTCLRKWLLVSMHCPTCRLSLLTEEEAQLRRDSEPRRIHRPRPPFGIMGLLQTGQTLLDLFGGWDPLPDETTEAPVPATSEAASPTLPPEEPSLPTQEPSHVTSNQSPGPSETRLRNNVSVCT